MFSEVSICLSTGEGEERCTGTGTVWGTVNPVQGRSLNAFHPGPVKKDEVWGRERGRG